MSMWVSVLPHRTRPTTRTWELPDTLSQYEFRLLGDLTGGSQVCTPLDYELDVKSNASSDSQQKSAAQVSKYDLKTYTIFVANEYKGQNARDAELEELPSRAFSSLRVKT